jgi:membrane-bound serine protease (ClpP class)
MTAVLVLFMVGILLVVIEVIVPGGLLGLVGGFCLLAGVITSFLQFGSTGGMIATAVALVIGAVTVYLEFVILPKTALAKKFTMSATVSGRSQPEVADPAAVLGVGGVAATRLAPSGVATIAGRRYEVFCQSGLAEAGARVKVVAVDNFRLVVTQIKETS